MAERAGAAVHVHLVVRQAVLFHRRHGDDREGLVDLVEVDLPCAPAGLLEELLHRAHGRGGEPAGLLLILSKLMGRYYTAHKHLSIEYKTGKQAYQNR